MKEHGVLAVSIKASNLYVRFNCGLCGRSTKDDGFETNIEGIGKICPQCRDKGSESYIHSCLAKRSELLQRESVRLMDLAKFYKIEWPTTAELDAELLNRLKLDEKTREEPDVEDADLTASEKYYRKEIAILKSYSKDAVTDDVG